MMRPSLLAIGARETPRNLNPCSILRLSLIHVSFRSCSVLQETALTWRMFQRLV